MGAIDLRLGDWRDVLADVECDTLITDSPYGARTHAGHDAGVDHTLIGNNGGGYRSETTRRRKLGYAFWTPDDVREFVAHWSPRTLGWFCAFSCSDLFPVWRQALADEGRCTFAPLACVTRGMSVRISGDGPASWTVYLNVARPRTKEFAAWGALPGAYITKRAATERAGKGRVGGKTEELMRAIVGDYTSRDALICDPCAGYGTTLQTAIALGRRVIGAEVDPETHATAIQRLDRGQMELAIL